MIRANSSAEAKSRALRAVNEVRALHQLPAAGYADGYDSEVQEASLVQIANGYLSHKPKEGDKCFSAAAAAGAGSSNLFKASSASDPARDIFAWTNDDTNSPSALAGVGHRRWILSPGLGQVAYGKVRGASALKVFRFARQAPVTLPPQISYIAMPSGMYPYLLVSPQTTPWSISTVSPGAPGTTPYNYFAEAKVSVRETGKNGQELAVRSLYSKANGPIRPSFLSWMVDGWKYDTEYLVRVTDIQQPGGAVTEFQYPVRIVRERLRGGG